ncbi:hypothetical protein JW848_08335 [Candidatus Bipolaricaulota bacterium]|nr:hypothetical protein [Candidatus Bipolaricaulota bacterium]
MAGTLHVTQEPPRVLVVELYATYRLQDSLIALRQCPSKIRDGNDVDRAIDAMLGLVRGQDRLSSEGHR